MSTQYPSRGPRRRRPRSRRGNNPQSRSFEPKKKKNPILAFFEKLFGKKSPGHDRSNGAERRENGARSPRREGRRLNIEQPASAEAPAEPHDNRPADDANQPEATSPRLYIGNLSYDASESDLFDLFAQVGAVKNVEIVRDRRGSSKGFGFVEMDSLEIANQAITKLNRTDFMGRPMVVGGAKK